MTLSSSELLSRTLLDSLGREVWTIPELLRARADATPNAVSLWQLAPTGAWQATTWLEYALSSERFANALCRLSLQPGDRVGILAPSSRSWDFAQMGILAAGGVVVGLDLFDTDEHLDDIAMRCELSGLVVSDSRVLARLSNQVRGRLRFVISIAEPEISEVRWIDDVMHLGKSGPTEPGLKIDPDAPATIIFTSGTTGVPKGISYTHKQICLAAASIPSAFPDIDRNCRLACWLPLSNLFQRMINICAIVRGAQSYYVEKPQDVMRHLAIIKPHVFIGVPRFYEKLYAGIQEKIDQTSGWKRMLASWAMRQGERHAEMVRTGKQLNSLDQLRHWIADKLVLRRIRVVMGGSLSYMVSGSAPMPRWLLERFHAIGLLILEAYGMSENIIPNAANRPSAYRFGTVGHPLPGSEVRLAADGELLVRGPGVFAGYFGESAQDSIRDLEGYLGSGDYATIDVDGFITLTGRKSEIFKTSTGRRIAPGAIEAVLRRIPAVEHAVAVGAGRQFVVAILAITGDSVPDCDQLRSDVRQVLVSIPEYQRPAGLLLTRQAFTLAGGELTANLKLRRAAIVQSYQDFLAELYGLLESEHREPFQITYNNGQVMLCNL